MVHVALNLIRQLGWQLQEAIVPQLAPNLGQQQLVEQLQLATLTKQQLEQQLHWQLGQKVPLDCKEMDCRERRLGRRLVSRLARTQGLAELEQEQLVRTLPTLMVLEGELLMQLLCHLQYEERRVIALAGFQGVTAGSLRGMGAAGGGGCCMLC